MGVQYIPKILAKMEILACGAATESGIFRRTPPGAAEANVVVSREIPKVEEVRNAVRKAEEKMQCELGMKTVHGQSRVDFRFLVRKQCVPAMLGPCEYSVHPILVFPKLTECT